jgi:DnaA-like protein
MKPGPEICAELRDRDLYDLCDSVARRQGVRLADICSPSRAVDVVEARHAIWHRLYVFFGGNASAVARVFGVDHATVLSAMKDQPPAIVRVLLAKFETESHAYHLIWISGRVNPFGVIDRVADQTTWFPTYELAHAAFVACEEQAGAPTFHARSTAQLGGAS